MSALSSAIHNTGHYHVRPRPVCLSPSCARSANNGHGRRSSCALTSLDLAARYARGVTKDSAYRLQRTCAESAAGVLGLVFCPIAVWRRIAQTRREANCQPSEGKIKGARCGPVGWMKRADRSRISHEVRSNTTTCRFAQHTEKSRLRAPRVPRHHACDERDSRLMRRGPSHTKP
jgi:hypothetical protein